MHVRITQINVKQVNLEAKQLVHSDTLKYDTHSHKPTARVQGFNNGTAVAVAGAGCRAVLSGHAGCGSGKSLRVLPPKPLYLFALL